MVAVMFQMGAKSRVACFCNAAATRVSCEWLMRSVSDTRAISVTSMAALLGSGEWGADRAIRWSSHPASEVCAPTLREPCDRKPFTSFKSYSGAFLQDLFKSFLER